MDLHTRTGSINGEIMKYKMSFSSPKMSKKIEANKALQEILMECNKLLEE